MVYRFIGLEGNFVRIGGVDAEALETLLKDYLDKGWSLATAEEYDGQVLGVLNKQIEELQAQLKPGADKQELEKTSEEKAAE